MNKRAYFAGGCFWCTEAIFMRINGVRNIAPIYVGGKTKNPTYEEVCSGLTGHAEGVELVYDSKIIDYKSLVVHSDQYEMIKESLVILFFSTHDPTTINRQGNDVGTQYRSAIFFKSNDEKIIIKNVITELQIENIYEKPIVTEISLMNDFYLAESLHKSFYENNLNHPYCQAIISPKIKKLLKKHQKFLK